MPAVAIFTPKKEINSPALFLDINGNFNFLSKLLLWGLVFSAS